MLSHGEAITEAKKVSSIPATASSASTSAVTFPMPGGTVSTSNASPDSPTASADTPNASTDRIAVVMSADGRNLRTGYAQEEAVPVPVPAPAPITPTPAPAVTASTPGNSAAASASAIDSAGQLAANLVRCFDDDWHQGELGNWSDRPIDCSVFAVDKKERRRWVLNIQKRLPVLKEGKEDAKEEGAEEVTNAK